MKVELESAIRQHFTEVISDYNLQVQVLQSGNIWLTNDDCIVRFIYDFGSVEASFVDPEEKRQREAIKRPDGFPSGYPIYPAYAVWRFLYPTDEKDYSYKEWDLEGQVSAEKNLIAERLTHVLKGDFSWTTAYKANEAADASKVKYMMTHWHADHPVRIKFKQGNPEWKTDFEQYKKKKPKE